MDTPKKQWRMRRSSSGTWSPWRTMQDNFQYEMAAYDKVEFRDDPGPCNVHSPFFVDGVKVPCENVDGGHNGNHEHEWETYDSYGNYQTVSITWPQEQS